MVGSEGKLAEVKARISAAAEQSGREPSAIRLIAVSKTFEPNEIEPVLRAGHGDFGENRVQEARRKWPGLRASYPGIQLHLIGRLQTNKVRDAVAVADAIHTLDNDKLGAEIAKEIARQGRRPTLLVQVNTGREAQKAGIASDQAAAFVKRCRETHGLTIDGLMCIPPADTDPAPHFSMLSHLAGELDLVLLSMGMSDDFETAIRCGATHVRVGSAIFGQRASPVG